MSTQPNPQPAVQPAQADVRYEGRLKVTGRAKYAAEFPVENVAYAVMVQSTIPNGTITEMDTKRAESASGVLAVMTPFNAARLPGAGKGAIQPPAGRTLSLLQDKEVHYNGQPIAVVVARSLNEAIHGAELISTSYKTTPAKLDFHDNLDAAYSPKPGRRQPDTHRGDFEAGMQRAEARVEETYSTPIQNHNPMEPHATIAAWDRDKLSLYDATQYISGVQSSVAKTMGIPADNVRVQCPYTGGGFGSKGSTWSHVVLAAMAAKQVGRPVKLVLERPQMFGPVGSRPQTLQKIALGATKEGKLTAMRHDVIAHTSVMEDFLEPSAVATRMLYDSASNVTSHRLVALNLGVGTFQRAPGEATGTFALESALDELAYKLKMDPVELRMKNYAEKDPESEKPWTEKNLLQCYKQAAERFGWAKRNAEPRSMRDGDKLIGWGMATATYPANRSAAQAVVRIFPDGHAYVGSGSQDLGTGTYTIMQQTAADTLGVDLSMMEVKIGDSTLPRAPVSGGSQSAASVLPAVKDAAKQARLKVIEMAVADAASPLHGALPDEIVSHGGKLSLKSDASKSESYAAILARHGSQAVEAQAEAQPSEDRDGNSAHSWGAVFAEVAVDPYVHMMQVRRVVGTYDIGTLLNKKTGLNQLVGGIVWGVSLALLEESHIDLRYGRTVNENLGEYHVPVNADIGEIDVTALGIPDMKFNPLGSRGIGEIGITGASAAIANAIYHATGKRVRDLPITLDKLMG